MNDAPSKCRLSGHGFGVGAGVVVVGGAGLVVLFGARVVDAGVVDDVVVASVVLDVVVDVDVVVVDLFDGGVTVVFSCRCTIVDVIGVVETVSPFVAKTDH